MCMLEWWEERAVILFELVSFSLLLLIRCGSYVDFINEMFLLGPARSTNTVIFSSAKELMFSPMSVCLFVCLFITLFIGWFVNRVAQILLNRFPRVLNGGWVSAHKKQHSLFQLLVSYRDLAKVSTLLSATPVSSGFVTFYWVQVSSAVQQTLYRCVLGMTQIKPIRVLFLISVQSQVCLCLAHCYFNSATSFIQRLVCGCIKSYFISWNYTREKPMWVLHRN